MGPRWRTSTPAAYLSKSLTLCAGAAAMSARVSTLTILTVRPEAGGAIEPVTLTSPSVTSLPVAMATVSAGSGLMLMPLAEAWARVKALSTPMTTSRPKQAKSEYPLRWKRRNTRGSRLMKELFLHIWF